MLNDSINDIKSLHCTGTQLPQAGAQERDQRENCTFASFSSSFTKWCRNRLANKTFFTSNEYSWCVLSLSSFVTDAAAQFIQSWNKSHWSPLTQRQILFQHRHSFMAMLSRHCKNLHVHVFKYHHNTDTDMDMEFAVHSMMLQTATSTWVWRLLTCFFFASRAAWSEAWTVAFLNSTSRAFSISSCMRISSYARVLYNLRSTSFCLSYN